jgi:hypothetical protein
VPKLIFKLCIFFILVLDPLRREKFQNKTEQKEVMNSLNLNTSTPIKRIRFRGDSFQETEPLLDNDHCDEPHSTKNGELPKERGLFTMFL